MDDNLPPLLDVIEAARLALQRIDEWKSALTEDELIWMGHIDVAVQCLRNALGERDATDD